MENIDSTWMDKGIPALLGGLNTSMSAESIKDDELTSLSNIFIYEGSLRSDSGYDDFGIAVRGNPRGTYKLSLSTGVIYTILVTNATVYVWDVGAGQWQYVSNGVETVTSGVEVAGQTSIGVSDRTGFVADQYVGITLDDGSQHLTTITSGYTPATGAGNITIDDAIPTGRQADAGADFVAAVALNGNDNDQVMAIALPSEGALAFTNNNDNVQIYDGSTCEDLGGLPGGDCQCKALGLQYGHLLLFHTTESGVTYPNRVRNSDTYNFTNWATGNAGFEDLYDTEDNIVAAAPLGPYYIIYKEKTIIRQEYIGTEDVLFNRDTMIDDEGAVSTLSVIKFRGYHIFMGQSNIYKYRGGFDLEKIGKNVYSKVYGKDGDINPNYKSRILSLYINELKEAWFLYPTESDTFPQTMLRYKEDTGTWTIREFPVGISGYGFFTSSEVITWATAQGTWSQAAYAWNAKSLLSNSPTIHLCSADNDVVYEYDFVSPDDNGTDISWEFETKDFSDPDYFVRVDSITAFARGSSVQVQYSTDRGNSWNSLSPATISSAGMEEHVLHGQFVGRRFRLRFSGTGPGFELIWLKFDVSRESGW